MIVYGWNARNIKQAPLETYECPHCQQKQSVLVIFAKYIHIFWIPLFPFKKTAVVVCSNCKHETEEKAITLGSTATIKQLKAAVPIPKYLFSGLALIIIAIGYFTYQGMQDDKRDQSYIDNPQAGDVYLIKSDEALNEYNHYLLKVRDVDGDSLWVSYSSYYYNGIVTQLDPNDGFYNIMYPMHKDGIKDYNKSGALKKVMRDYNSAAGFDREIEFVESDSLSVD
jgi:hypothetical protein